MTGFDPASFRDPSGRLFRHAGSLYRTCSPDALTAFTRARESGLIEALTTSGLLVPTSLVESGAEGLPSAEVGSHVLKQAELPLVSYSYEWSFSMLRDAALLTLAVLDACLTRHFVLKDATAFNVLFEGSTPRLVDIHSIEPRAEGSIWAGYAQFCRAFLFPLLLWSHKGIDPRPLLLAGVGEIPVTAAARAFGWRDRLKPGVFVNVAMQLQLERRFANRAEDVGRAGAGIKYPLSAFRGQVAKLRKVIEGLRPPQDDDWTTYASTHTYDDEGSRAKEAFVLRSLEVAKPSRALDLGTNTGRFARLARATGAGVVAVDISAACIDAVYREARGDAKLSPLVADLTKPTPAIGWRNIERRALLDRLRGDAVMALALVHHLRITGGIPLAEVVDLLTAMAPAGVIEWIGREDAMVKRLLALRPDVYDDYFPDTFQRLLASRARIAARQTLPGGRVLYQFER